jgi:GT2 family glycosyltransferase
MQMAFLAWHSEVPIYFDRDAPPEVSIIVPVYGCLEELECCLRSIVLSKNKLNIEVILIDDKPDSPVVPLIPSSPGLVKIVNNENIGFLLSCNKAAQTANGKFLLFLNTDVILAFGSIDALIAALKEYPNAVMVGGMLLNNDGTVQDAGWKINIDGSGDPIGRGDCPTDHLTRKVVDCVTGACFLITKQLWSTLGGFDTIYAPAYYEEFDLAFRARQLGLVTIYEPRCRVVHLGARSYGTVNRDVMSQNNRMVFLRRFEKILGSG